jgi:hypothetical protein
MHVCRRSPYPFSALSQTGGALSKDDAPSAVLKRCLGERSVAHCAGRDPLEHGLVVSVLVAHRAAIGA